MKFGVGTFGTFWKFFGGENFERKVLRKNLCRTQREENLGGNLGRAVMFMDLTTLREED